MFADWTIESSVRIIGLKKIVSQAEMTFHRGRAEEWKACWLRSAPAAIEAAGACFSNGCSHPDISSIHAGAFPQAECLESKRMRILCTANVN